MPAPISRYDVRGSMVIRQWNLLVSLRRRAYTLGMLARKFGCTTRTIRRDLELLQGIGLHIAKIGSAEWGDDGVYYRFLSQPSWPRGERWPLEEIRRI